MTENKRPKLMGTGDVSKYLGVTQQYIDQLIKAGKIPYQKISTCIVFFEDDIIEFAKRRNQKTKLNKK